VIRSSAVMLAVLVVSASPAWATYQTPEVLHINGRVVPLLTTPLDPVLKPLLMQREDLRERLLWNNSGLMRGYVGTWHIEGDLLYLVSLQREERDVWKDVPLSLVFGDATAPIPATWFTGILRVPVGWACRYVHEGFATTWNEELLIHVVRGRIVRQEVLDVRHALRGRSCLDLACSVDGPGSPADPGIPDAGHWRDARSIGTAPFREEVPPGTSFITRGVLGRTEDGPYGNPHRWLLAPKTPVTEEVEFRMSTELGLSEDDAYHHVEIDTTWHEEDGKVVLDVRWLRYLRYGETIHHPSHPLPDLPPLPVDGDERPDTWDADVHYCVPPPTPVGSGRAHYSSPDDALFGRRIDVYGTLAAGAPSQVYGVDVADADDLVGKEVIVSGVIQKWIITDRLLDLDHPDISPFKERGPGTYYRVVEPETGRLARPREAPVGD
jgi:hypothetical protein